MLRAASFLLILLTACSTVAPEGERLLADIPPGWERIYQMDTGRARLSDFAPTGETQTDWTTRLSFESFDASEINTDPIDLLLAEAEADMKKCNFVQHFNIHSGYENNYETSVRLIMCGENAFSGKGEVKLVKMIAGNDYVYSIRMARRLAPFTVNQPDVAKHDIASWSAYFSRISLCDDTDAHPCPESSAED